MSSPETIQTYTWYGRDNEGPYAYWGQYIPFVGDGSNKPQPVRSGQVYRILTSTAFGNGEREYSTSDPLLIFSQHDPLQPDDYVQAIKLPNTIVEGYAFAPEYWQNRRQ